MRAGDAQLCFISIAVFLHAANSTAIAATYSWQVPSGDWSITSNWGGTLPTSPDTAIIANGGTANITSLGEVCYSLYLGDPNSGNNGAIQMSNGGLTANYAEFLGNNGAGTFNQSGGANSFGSYLVLGYNPNSNGSYCLAGTGTLSGNTEYLGFSGSGTLTQSGGTSTLTYLYDGGNAGSSGDYTLSAPGVLSAHYEYLGYYATAGSFAQSGGTNNLGSSGFLYLGYTSTGSGSYNLSGPGVLNCFTEYLGYSAGTAGSYALGGDSLLSAGTEQVGRSGNIIQSGGSNSAGFLTILAGGRYQFSGGTLQIGSLANQGTFDVTGSTGLLAVAGSGIVDLTAVPLVNTGSMSLSVAPNGLVLLPVGFNPATALASFNNQGVTYVPGTTLTIPRAQHFSLTYSFGDFVNCQGALLAANGPINLNSGLALSGTGVVSLGQGQLTVNDTVSGISGGSLAAYAEYVGNTASGAFNQSGGTNDTGILYVGNNGFGAFTTTSGSYTLGGSAVLSAGGEYVGGFISPGVFVQSGGMNSTSTLTIGSQGRYQFSGGTLQATWFGFGLSNQGTFDATGSTGLLTIAGSSVVDLSNAILVKTGSMSLSVGPDSLLLLPSGLNPTTAFASFSSQGLTHNVGTQLSVLPGQGFVGAATITDYVSCQGAISSQWSTYSGSALASSTTGSVILHGGITVSGTGNANLGLGWFISDNPLSGVSGGVLAAATGYVGYSATGAFTHTGGAVSVTNLYLGYNAGSSGTYSLGGPAVLSAASEFVGDAGAGLFSQSGGWNSATDLLIGRNGRYQFSGGTLQLGGLSNQGVFDAMGGTGVLTTVGNQIVDFSQSLPVNAGSMTLSVGPNSLLLVPSSFNPAVFGSYTNQGMTHHAGTPLPIAAGQAFSGEFNLNDPLACQGTISAVSGGSINLYGGLWVAGGGNVNLGGGAYFADNVATAWSMSGGALTASFGYVGYAGTGTFTQSGGTQNLSSGPFNGALYLGYNAGSNGTYNLNGPGVLNTTSEFIGYSGVGTMNQSAGTNTTGFFGDLYIGYNAGASGHYNQSGGTNNVSWPGSLYLGDGAGSNGGYSLSSSGLLTAATEFVGYSGTGTFTQTSGLNSAGYLNIGALGRYRFTGGTLQVTNLGNQGAFDATGCTGQLTASDSAIVDLSAATLVNIRSMSVSIGPDSLVLLPAGFNPSTSFHSYSAQGLTHNVGMPLLIASGQGFAGAGAISDFVSCQGDISAVNGSINLNGGVAIAGSGSVNLGSAGASVNDATSSISGGTLQANTEYVGKAAAGMFTESGGYNDASNEYVGYSGTGAFTQSGGTNAVSESLYLAQNIGSVGTYNLNGGLLTVAAGIMAGSGNVEFNLGAGTLQATGAWSSPVNITRTGSGPAGTINTAGNSITLSGDIRGSGDLTKIGAGSLILSGSNTYDGFTTVAAGTLLATDPAALPDGGSLIVGAEAVSAFGTLAVVVPGGLAPAVVPEPSTLALVGAVALALLAGGRWGRHAATTSNG